MDMQRWGYKELSDDASYGQIITPEWLVDATKMQRDSVLDWIGDLFAESPFRAPVARRQGVGPRIPGQSVHSQ